MTRKIAGLVCLKDKKVLLVTSRKKKRWILPKGGVEINETEQDAAIREAYEEAGIKATDVQSLGTIIFKDETYFWFKTNSVQLDNVWPESSERQRKWFPYEEAKTILRPDMLDALNRAIN